MNNQISYPTHYEMLPLTCDPSWQTKLNPINKWQNTITSLYIANLSPESILFLALNIKLLNAVIRWYEKHTRRFIKSQIVLLYHESSLSIVICDMYQSVYLRTRTFTSKAKPSFEHYLCDWDYQNFEYHMLSTKIVIHIGYHKIFSNNNKIHKMILYFKINNLPC